MLFVHRRVLIAGLAALALLVDCVLDARGTGQDASGGQGPGGAGVAICDPVCVAKGECWLAECVEAGTCEDVPAPPGSACGHDDFCDGAGRCLLRDGDACSSADDCGSAHCVDGICCEGPCASACHRCVDEGRCEAIVSGEDPDAECERSCDGIGHCALGELDWAERWGAGQIEATRAVAVAPNGDIALSIVFQGTIVVDGESFTAQNYDSLIVRLAANGDVKWAARVAGTGDAVIVALAFDADGRVIAGGHFSAGVAIGSLATNATGPLDGLLLTLAVADGSLVWGKVLTGVGSERVPSVGVRPDGTLLVGGYFDNGIDLDGALLSTQQPGEDGFIAAYAPTGVLDWHVHLTGPGMQQVTALSSGPGTRVWAGGLFDGSFTAGSVGLTTNGGFDGFLVALDDESPTWGTAIGTANSTQAVVSVAARSDGGVVATGYYDGLLAPGGPMTKGLTDVFVAAYDTAGQLELLDGFGSVASDLGLSIAVDPVDNMVVTGVIDGPADFGGGDLPAQLSEVFVVKRTIGGDHLWSRSFGGSFVEQGNAVATDGQGVVVGGAFASSDFTIDGTLIPNMGSVDAFCVRLGP